MELRHRLAFRDYFCAHPEEAQSYERLKTRLAAQQQTAPARRRRDPCLDLVVVRRDGLDRLRSDQRHSGRERSHRAGGGAAFLRCLAVDGIIVGSRKQKLNVAVNVILVE
jgi:hypothetical protein